MQKKQESGLGIAGMVLGIASLVLSCAFVGGITSVIGITLSLVSLSQKDKGQGTAIAGLILNIIAILVSGFFILLFIADSNNDSSQTQNNLKSTEIITETIESEPDYISTEESLPKEEPSKEIKYENENTIDCTLEKCNIKYLRHELITNQGGEDCIVIYYEFTNNSKEKQVFSYVVEDKAFQNGVELEKSFWVLEDVENNDYLEIKPGVTITVYSSFVIRDESNVEVEIEKWSAWEEKVYDSMTIKIK